MKTISLRAQKDAKLNKIYFAETIPSHFQIWVLFSKFFPMLYATEKEELSN